MPAGDKPLPVAVAPELMVPLAVTLMVLLADDVIAVASLTARIPALPESTASPLAVETERSPEPRLRAPIPYVAVPVIVTPEPAPIETSPLPFCVALMPL